MFVFLPLLAWLMMLMYWRPRHYYVEHLLLFMHNHAFVFLVTAVLLLPGPARAAAARAESRDVRCTLPGTCTAPCGSSTGRDACSR